MTEEQVEQAEKTAKKLAVGLLGTKDSPTQFARFLEVYIELNKEFTAMSANADSFVKNKARLDTLLSLATDLRELESQYKEEEHERD